MPCICLNVNLASSSLCHFMVLANTVARKKRKQEEEEEEEENPSRMGQNKKFTFHEILDDTAYVPKW